MSSQIPQKLAAKLKHVRVVELDYSEKEMAKALNVQGITEQDVINYESGASVPSLLTVLAYARSAGVIMEKLVDDALEIRPNTGKW